MNKQYELKNKRQTILDAARAAADAGDMETYKSTNLDELIRACRASARYGAAEKGGGGR